MDRYTSCQNRLRQAIGIAAATVVASPATLEQTVLLPKALHKQLGWQPALRSGSGAYKGTCIFHVMCNP